MESSRRSIDRSRDAGSLKKPRLVEDADRDRSMNRERQFPQRASGPLVPRLRANERERDDGREDPARGSVAYQQQQQEIVGQYKTALAELTFNSKPIITNLTIIAGENLHAAKGIAATVCANILEVPSEQKLPSLYLLDSIVKNIGRDYIKYFAARLPEVFCKAYRQVDSSIHPGMRHLFGTWRGVFPPATLQSIEKELGFQPAINGSSSGATTSRPDSQAQRPPHSIHVNPKYLEARQRLQQSSRAKGLSSDDGGTMVKTTEDEEKPDRTSFTGSARPWTEPPSKRSQREQLDEPAREKNPDAGYGDHEFASDLPRRPDLGLGKANERITGRSSLDQSWYGAGSKASETTAGQRNGFDFPNAYGNYRETKSSQNVSQLPPTEKIMSRSTKDTLGNWKNSEEEEYMWEDINSRLTDHGGTDNSRKDGWNQDDAEKAVSLKRGKWMPLETELLDARWGTLDSSSRIEKPPRGEDRVPLQRDVEDLPQSHGREDSGSSVSRENTDSHVKGLVGQGAFGHRKTSVWPNPEPLSVDGLNHKNISSIVPGQRENVHTPLSGGLSTSLSSSLGRTGLQLHMGPSGVLSSLRSVTSAVSGSGSMFGHQWKQPPRPSSPSTSSSGNQRAHSPTLSTPRQHQHSQTLGDQDHLQMHSSHPGVKPSQLSGQWNRAPQIQASQDSFHVLPQNQIQPPGLLRSLPIPSSQPLPQLQSSSSSLAPFGQVRHFPSFSQQPQSELSMQQTLSQSSDQKSSLPFGAPKTTLGYSGPGHVSNPVADILGQSSTGSLLATIMKSGLVTVNNPVSSFSSTNPPDLSTQSHLNIPPPLPSGRPPIQLTASSVSKVTPTSLPGPVSHVNASAPSTNSLKALLPPLPPGPPPSSSLVGTSSQGLSTASSAQNPLSNLLSSLVAKGLISAPQKEVMTITASQGATSSSLPVSSSSSSTIPASSSDKELSFSESAPRDTSLSQATVVETKGLIGLEFKPEFIRELHPLVINGLFDDLPHQCGICGFRLKFQEQLSKHMEYHDLKKHEVGNCDTVSRKWYVGLCDWIAGNIGPPTGPVYITSMEETVTTEELCEPMVPADESQCICILCGEPFEDFYSEDMDGWMYKGAIYMPTPTGKENTVSTDEGKLQGPIVHSNCISRSSMDGFEVS